MRHFIFFPLETFGYDAQGISITDLGSDAFRYRQVAGNTTNRTHHTT